LAARTPEEPGAAAEPSAGEGNAATAGQIATGPLFWPQLPGDLADYIFRPSGTDDPFWSIGYADVVDGALRPASRHPGHGAPRAAQPSATAGASGAPDACPGGPGAEIADGLVERITQTIAPTDAQQGALAELRSAARHGFEYFDASCPSDRPQSPMSRLDSMEDRIWAARQALLILRAPLETLYRSLTDEQKARLNGPIERPDQREATCATTNPELPLAQFGRALRSKDQRAGLEALKTTSAGLAKLLASSCPSGMPATPVGRLDAADKRLNSLLYAVATLRAPLDAFYASLDTAQKSRLNASR
jgi:hypothetical protein